MTEDTEHLEINTTISRSPLVNSVFSFEVVAELEERLDQEKVIAGRLKGSIVKPFMWDVDFYEDYFDSDNQHSHECWDVLVNQSEKIENVLATKDEDFELEHVTEIIFCEKLEVLPKYRGHALALRLMREIRYVFSSSPLMILRAWPDGNGDDNSARQLAQYYMRDIHLGLTEVDSENLIGWLVGIGNHDFFQAIENNDDCEVLIKKL